MRGEGEKRGMEVRRKEGDKKRRNAGGVLAEEPHVYFTPGKLYVLRRDEKSYIYLKK